MKGKLLIGFMILCSILITGCHNGRTEESENASEEVIQEQSVYYEVEEEVTPNYKKGITMSAGGHIYTPARSFAGESVYQTTISSGADYTGGEMYWQTWRSGMSEWENADLRETNMEYEDGTYGLSGIIHDSSDNKVYAKAYRKDTDENEAGGDYIAQLGEKGIEEIIGPLPEGFLEDGSLFRDKEGNFYKCTSWSDLIICYDGTMNEIKEFQVPKYAYGIMQGAEGTDVYWYGCDMSNQPIVGNLTDGSIVLEGVEGIATDYFADITEEGVIILADSQNLWRVENGIAQKVFPFAKNGYLMQLYHMEVNEQGEIVLWVMLDNTLTMLRMKETDKPQEKQEIMMAFTQAHSALEKSVARFNRQSKGYFITVMLPEEEESAEDFRRRIQLEMSVGRGPDILGHDMVSDMQSYVENGYLECMDELFTDTSQYLTAALDTCRVEDKLYGVPYECSFCVTAYDKKLVGERSCINMEELMDAVRASEANVLEEGIAGVTIVEKYALYDDSNKSYIDWEKGESYLNQPAFIEVLEFAKEYADDKEGEKNAFAVSPIDYQGLCALRELKSLYGDRKEDVLLLGYPREEGNGIYVNTRQLFLRANAACKEGAKEFLRFLISEEEQQKYAIFDPFKDMQMSGQQVYIGHKEHFAISLKALDLLLEQELAADQENLVYTDTGVIQVNAMYTTDMIEQFKFMIEHAKPNISKVDAIEDIIEEELWPYFTGKASVEVVSEKLHNRVQLYLDERIK